MLFEESRSIRAFVGCVTPGDDVLEALTLLCDANDVTSAQVRMTGTLREAEIVRFDSATHQYVTELDHAGPFHIVHSTGQMAKLGDQPVLRVDALLAVDGPGGQQLVFGQLRRGAAVDCEFVVETFEDLAVERKLDPSNGRFPIVGVERLATASPRPERPAAPPRERKPPATVSEPAGTAAPAPTAPGAENSDVSWADAMEASSEIKPASQREKPALTRRKEKAAPKYADFDPDEPVLTAGDILDHPKLGECRVIRVEDDDYAHIRLSRGQIRKLALEVIELIYEGERDGKNVFKVRVRK